MVFRDMNSRGQVDLIDMQSQADGEFQWILVYQDHLTKFVRLRATKSKRAAEVAYHLLDIFVSLVFLQYYKVIMDANLQIPLLLNLLRCGMV